MTTLIERMDQLFENIQLLANSRVTQDQAQGFRTRAEELSALATTVMVPVKRAELLRQQPIDFQVPRTEARELKVVIDEMRASYEANPSSILNPDTTWRYSTRNRLQKLAEQINDNLTLAWREYIERTRPDVDQAPLHVLQNAPAYAAQAGRIRSLLSQFEELAKRLPVSSEEIGQPGQLAGELRRVTQDIPSEIPRPVRELFESINQRTANAAQLTEEVVQWLRVNNLLETLRISWRQT